MKEMLATDRRVYRMKPDSKLSWVALFCAVGTLTGSILLYRDISDTGVEGHGTPLAKVEKTDQRVRRKPSTSFIWNQVQEKQNLFKHESVQTGEKSGALIRLNDGSTLEMKENSLVVIDDLNNLATGFLRGSMILHGAENDSTISINADGKVIVQALKAQLLSPAALSELSVEGARQRPVAFTWKISAGEANSPSQTEATLQISSDERFTKASTRSFRTRLKPGETNTITDKLASGNYYWRILRGQEVLSEVARFSVISQSALHPLAPSNHQNLEFFGAEPSAIFKWLIPKDAQETALHEIQVSKDSNFSHIILSRKIQELKGSEKIEGLPEGQLYWRIQTQGADLTLLSSVEAFTISLGHKREIALLQPEDDAFVATATPQLLWKGNPEERLGSTYSIELEEIGTNAQKNPPQAEFQFSGNSAISSQALKSGHYRWRVVERASVNGANEKVGESTWRKLNIDATGALVNLTPLRNQDFVYWTAPSQFNFSWSQAAFVNSDHPENHYRVEFSQTPSFNDKFFTIETKDTELKNTRVKLTEGTHFWRVSVVNTEGRVLKTGEVSNFNYRIHPILTAPVASLPASGTTLRISSPDQKAVLSWNETENAKHYEVTLTHRPKGRTPGSLSEGAITQTVERPSFEIKNLAEGTYFWTVRAVDSLNRSGAPTPMASLVIDAGDLLPAPEVTSQEVQ